MEKNNLDKKNEVNDTQQIKENGINKNVLIIIISILAVFVFAFGVYRGFKEEIGNTTPTPNPENKQEKPKESKYEYSDKEDFSDPTIIKDQKELYHIVDAQEIAIKQDDQYANEEKCGNVKVWKEISFDYPVIDIDNEEINEANKDIHDFFQESYYRNINKEYDEEIDQVAMMKDDKYYGGRFLELGGYSISEGEDYLTFFIWKMEYATCTIGDTSAIGYVVDKNSKTLMKKSDMIKKYDVTEKTIIDAYNEKTHSSIKATSLDEIDLLIMNDKLVLLVNANGYSLYQYDADHEFTPYRSL